MPRERDLSLFKACDGLPFRGKDGAGYVLRAGRYGTGNGALHVELENGESEAHLTVNLVDLNDELGDDEFAVRLETIEFSKAPQALLDLGLFTDTGRRIEGPHGQTYAAIWRFTKKVPMSIKLRHEHRGDHVHVDVFVGPDRDHLANAGRLVFRQDEWIAFGTVIAFGAAHMGVEVASTPELEPLMKEATSAIGAFHLVDLERLSVGIAYGQYQAVPAGVEKANFFVFYERGRKEWLEKASDLRDKLNEARARVTKSLGLA